MANVLVTLRTYPCNAETPSGTTVHVPNTFLIIDLFETRNVAVVTLLLVLRFATLLW